MWRLLANKQGLRIANYETLKLFPKTFSYISHYSGCIWSWWLVAEGLTPLWKCHIEETLVNFLFSFCLLNRASVFVRCAAIKWLLLVKFTVLPLHSVNVERGSCEREISGKDNAVSTTGVTTTAGCWPHMKRHTCGLHLCSSISCRGGSLALCILSSWSYCFREME